MIKYTDKIFEDFLIEEVKIPENVEKQIDEIYDFLYDSEGKITELGVVVVTRLILKNPNFAFYLAKKRLQKQNQKKRC